MASCREIHLLSLALPLVCPIVLAQSLNFFPSHFLTLSEGQKSILSHHPYAAVRFTLRTDAKCFEILDLSRVYCDENQDRKRHQQLLEKWGCFSGAGLSS